MPKPSIFQFKATLEGSKPPIWRRVHVYENMRLPKLHRVMQNIMKWEDYHLHEFKIGKLVYAIPDPEDKDFGRVVRDERRVLVNQKWKRPGDRHVYCYDFGDNWSIELVLEGILMPDPEKFYPCCVDGVLNSPPEDTGGIHSYQKLYLPVLADWRHPEHREKVQWRGMWDAETFDQVGINAALEAEFRSGGIAPSDSFAVVREPDGVAVQLNARERELILKYAQLEDYQLDKIRHRSRKASDTVKPWRGDLLDLLESVAEAANHASDRKLRAELGALCGRIEKIYEGWK
jgi:hypothetical protein